MIIVEDINNSLSNWIDYLNKKINEIIGRKDIKDYRELSMQ